MTMASLADHLGITGEHELVIGSSFQQNNSQSAFHTIRYDFKPASVDPSKSGSLEVGESRSVTVSLPHVDSANQTGYRGSTQPYQKECVLIIDHDTGQMRLEKLSDNLQLKKTRSETMSTASRLGIPSPRPMTPIDPSSVGGQRTPPQPASRRGGAAKKSAGASTTVARGRQITKKQHQEPPPVAAHKKRASAAPRCQTAPGSMPMLGFEDDEAMDPDDVEAVEGVPDQEEDMTQQDDDDDGDDGDDIDVDEDDDLLRTALMDDDVLLPDAPSSGGGNNSVNPPSAVQQDPWSSVGILSDSGSSDEDAVDDPAEDSNDDEDLDSPDAVAIPAPPPHSQPRHQQPLQRPHKQPAADRRKGASMPSMPAAHLLTDLQLSDSD